MHLKSLSVKNFRALEEVEVEFNDCVNVIVGPNAIGKTTVLEAIKFAKGILAPRTQHEANQTLFALNASLPHNPRQLIPESLAKDPQRPLELRCGYQLSEIEVESLSNNIERLATHIVQMRAGGHQNPADFAAFLASPMGQHALRQTHGELAGAIPKVGGAKASIRLDLRINFNEGRIVIPNPLGPAMFSFLEQRLPPGLTLFSYFPADRALPRGEQPVQLGLQDAQNQLESHSSQPQLKYQRLKNIIFNAMLAGEESRKSLQESFAKIFSGIVKGRELAEDAIGLNRYGQLRINIRDTESGKTFDIDSLSSGEKGLLLTFLLMELSMQSGGLVLLDEPELHLNPLVCKEIIGYIVDTLAIPKDLQVIICSHSPEILAGAFGRDQCSLFHLRSGTLLTKVRRQDEEEISETLRRLGASETDALLYDGTIFVEGVEDVGLLETGFPVLLRRYNLRELGGRANVEKEIAGLQQAEHQGKEIALRYFIFDKDRLPTHIISSKRVKVLQWDRRCFDNYLLEIDSITDLLQDQSVVRTPLTNQGEVIKLLKELAISQLDDFVVREVYDSYAYENPGLRSTEIQGKTINTSADLLLARLNQIKLQVGALDAVSWKEQFLRQCIERHQQIKPIWEEDWRSLCDGKRLFRDLRQRLLLKISLDLFKRRIMTNMRLGPSESWRSVESLLKGLLEQK